VGHLSQSLNGQDRIFGGRGMRWQARDFLIIGQTALSMVLLMGAGVFVRAHYAMFNSNPGFETRQALASRLEVDPSHYSPDTVKSFYRLLEQRVRELPGIQSVCFAGSPPGAGGGLDADLMEVRLPGQEKGRENHPA
jgi:hypothetical protein